MPVFDVTHTITHSESVMERPDRYRRIKDLVAWLSEHVGDYYGTGEDRSINDMLSDESPRKGHSVLHIGSGWQLERGWKGALGGYMEVWWLVDITDEAKATYFALKWTK